MADWLREFKLIAFASDGEAEAASAPPAHKAPVTLLRLAEQLSTVYATEVSEVDRSRARAYAEGHATVDVVYPSGPEIEGMLQAWNDVLIQVDDFSRTGELLTLARPDDVKQFGDWVLGEFRRQLHGEAPLPWTGPLD